MNIHLAEKLIHQATTPDAVEAAVGEVAADGTFGEMPDWMLRKIEKELNKKFLQTGVEVSIP